MYIYLDYGVVAKSIQNALLLPVVTIN